MMESEKEFCETETLYNELLMLIKKKEFHKSRKKAEEALESAKKELKMIPEVCSKLILVLYIENPYGKSFYSEFKEKVKEIQNFEEIWLQTKKIILNDYLTLYLSLKSYIRLNYFIVISPWEQLLELIKDENTLDAVIKLLSLCKQCYTDISRSMLCSISNAAIYKLNYLIYEKKQKNFNEKNLEKSLTFIKGYIDGEELLLFNELVDNLMYEYITSDSIGKQLIALKSFNSFRGLTAESVQKLVDIKAVDKLLTGMHQDVAHSFVTFLIKMWENGEFHKEQLSAFWDLSIDQHQTVIDKFFAEWPRVFNALQKEQKSIFWEIVFASKKYPQSSLDFLMKLSKKADDDTRIVLIKSLMNVPLPERMQCIDTICEYAKISADTLQIVTIESMYLIKERKDVNFAVVLLLKLIKNPTKEMFDTVLDNAILPPESSQPLLDLIVKFCASFKSTLDTAHVDKIKAIIEPIIDVNPTSVSLFLNELTKMKAVSLESTEMLMIWLANQKDSMKNLVFSLFLKTNKIETGYFGNLNLIGINAILLILFKSSEKSVSDFVTNILSRCSNVSSIIELIKIIMNNQPSVASFETLKNLIVDVELTMNEPTIVNACNYAPFININLLNKGTISIPLGSSVDFFKKRVGSFLDKNYREIEFLIDDEPIEDSHFFKNDETIIIKAPSFSSKIQYWKQNQYPTNILKGYTSTLLEIVGENTELGAAAFHLLNNMPTVESEKEILETSSLSWETILDTSKTYLLMYRLNTLGNIIKQNNRSYILRFFETGGFLHLMTLLLEYKGIFHSQNDINLFMCILYELVKVSETISEAKEIKEEAYKTLRREVVVNTLIDALISLDMKERRENVMIYSAICLLNDVSKNDSDLLLNNEHFNELFETFIFDPRIEIQKSMSDIVLKMELDASAPLILKHLDKARDGNCKSYFELINKIVKEGNDPKSIWKTLSDSLMNNMFVISPNAIIPDDFGMEEKYKKEEEKQPNETAQNQNTLPNKNIDEEENKLSTDENEKNSFTKENEDENKESINNTLQNKEEIKSSDNPKEEKQTEGLENDKEEKENNSLPNKEEIKTHNDDKEEEKVYENKESINEKQTEELKNDKEEEKVYENKESINEKENNSLPNKEEIKTQSDDKKEKENVLENEKNDTDRKENAAKEEIKIQSDDKEEEKVHEKKENIKKEIKSKEEEKKKEDNILRPTGSFTIEELKEAALMMSAEIADQLFISCIFETLLELVDKISNPIPNALDLCLFSLNKVAFNVSRYIELPPQLFPLIESIIKREPSIASSVFKRLKTLHMRFNPRYASSKDTRKLQYTTRKGLYNMGCTCYINASLQQLLRVPEVRDAILSYRPSGNIQNDWLAQLQLLFAELLYFPCSAIYPSAFITNFKSPNGRPINPHEQQDAVEFIQYVMSSIDEKIPSKPIEHNMNGKIVHEIVSLDPEKEYRSTTIENFSTFALEVRDITDIQESFNIFKIPDLFTGNNQYKADEIGLIDAERRHAVREAPDTLVLQLKRFDFDMTTFERIKLNTPFNFPLILDIAPILENHEKCEYNLQGIIMHSGNSQGGHYYSYIKDKDGWFSYNDSRVSQIEEKTVMANATVSQKGIISLSGRISSGYLLFYRKKLPTNPDVEPICRMPAKMISYLLDEMQSLVLKNILFSKSYMHFVKKAISNASCEEAFEMAFALFSITDTPHNKMKENDGSLMNLMIEKAKVDEKFADYVLYKTNSFAFMIGAQNISIREEYTKLVVAAVSNSNNAEEFIQQLYPFLNDAFSNIGILPSILKAIESFVNHDTQPREDLLFKTMSVITDQFAKLSVKMQKNILAKFDLSDLFKTLRLLIERDPVGAEALKPIILHKDFKEDWFTSSKHTFELSSLLYFYLKDDEKLTEEHLRYIEECMNKKPISWFASNFASACIVDDGLVKKRLDFFFEELKNVKPLHEFIEVFTYHICENNSSSICKYLMNYQDIWVANWLSCPYKRASQLTAKMIYSFFPMFPIFETIPMEFCVQKSDFDRDSVDKEYFELIGLLWETLMNANKQIVISAYDNNDSSIAVNYFSLLSWATFYSKKEQVVDRLYLTLEKNLEKLIKLKNKDSVLSIFDFMHAFISNPFAFFNPNVLKNFLSQLSRITDDKILAKKVMKSFLPMIICISDDYANIILQSDFIVMALPLCFDDGFVDVMNEFLATVTKEECIEPLCKILFDKVNFRKALWSNNKGYLSTVLKCLKYEIAVDLFVSSKSPNVITEYIEDRAENKLFMEQIYGIAILINVVQSVAVNSKDKKTFFRDPLKPIINIFESSDNFLKVLIQEIKDISCPNQLSSIVAELLTVVFTYIPKFTDYGLALLSSKTDIYSLFEPSIRVMIAKLKSGLILRAAAKNKSDALIFFDDLNKMIRNGLYDALVFRTYVEAILITKGKFSSATICPILKFYFSKTSNIFDFDSSISNLLEMCSDEISNEDEDFMASKCFDIVMKICDNKDNDLKEIETPEKVENISARLKKAINFLKKLQTITGRSPEIKGGSKLCTIFCSNKEILEMMQEIGSYGVN